MNDTKYDKKSIATIYAPKTCKANSTYLKPYLGIWRDGLVGKCLPHTKEVIEFRPPAHMWRRKRNPHTYLHYDS